MNTNETTTYFTNRNGEKFFVRYFLPQRPKALLVVAHGLGEHSGRYKRLGEYFADRGYAVAVYDLRGHGRSVGKRGHVDHFESWVEDLRTFVWNARREMRHTIPTFVIGHSLGGLIALSYIAHYSGEVDGAVISAPALSPTIKVPDWKVWLGKYMARVLPKVSMGAEIKPEDLSRDPEVVDSYRKDPYVFKRVTVRAGDQILAAAAQSIPWAYKIKCPVLMIQGNDDRICSVAATKNFFTRLPEDYKKLKLYDGAFHEPFNDVIRDRVFADVEDWIDSARQAYEGDLMLTETFEDVLVANDNRYLN